MSTEGMCVFIHMIISTDISLVRFILSDSISKFLPSFQLHLNWLKLLFKDQMLWISLYFSSEHEIMCWSHVVQQTHLKTTKTQLEAYEQSSN